MADKDHVIERKHTPDLFAEERTGAVRRQSEEKERRRAFLFNRQRAYREVFKKDSEMVKQVLSDLSKFCRGSDSTFDINPTVHALMEGRREVLLRIMEHLELPSELLWELKQRKGA